MNVHSNYDDFLTEVSDLVKHIQKTMAIMAQTAEKQDGFHRCYRCGELMCDVSEPYAKNRYWQCFTAECKARKEFAN